MTARIHPLRKYAHPDLSDFVIHLPGRYGKSTDDVPSTIKALSPAERLQRILVESHILAFPMFQTPDPVVCFTECTRSGVSTVIAQGRYAAYGIAFEKDVVFQRGGGPAHYVRGDHFHKVDKLPEDIRAFWTRFWPGQDHESAWSTHDNFLHNPSEWLHEREWRIRGEGDPPTFSFALKEDVAFIVVPTKEDRKDLLLSILKASNEVGRELIEVPVIYIASDGTIQDLEEVWLS